MVGPCDRLRFGVNGCSNSCEGGLVMKNVSRAIKHTAALILRKPTVPTQDLCVSARMHLACCPSPVSYSSGTRPPDLAAFFSLSKAAASRR